MRLSKKEEGNKLIPENLKISLAAARVNAGLSQAEVADKLHVSNRTVISWEKYKTSPSVTQADALYNLFGRPKDSIKF
jgi:toxin-antitoxin system, antitoxin component, xre family|nr:MAG TPA: helix-turn-helix domain protein [Caudoviricetes sp.]